MRVVCLGVLASALMSSACLEVGDAPSVIALDAGLPQIDAAIDAAPTPVTLSHSTDPASVAAETSVACIQQQTDADGNSFPVFHEDNSYYRVFDLPALGVDRDLAIDRVSFGIQSASAGAATEQPIDIKLHTLDGELLVSNLTELATTRLSVPNQSQTIVEADIEALAPAGSTLVVEILVPSGDPDRLLFIGSNSAGQTGPSYLRAPACDDDADDTTPSAFEEPVDLTPFFPDMHVVMSVSGIY